jgi:hypothetical protein
MGQASKLVLVDLTLPRPLETCGVTVLPFSMLLLPHLLLADPMLVLVSPLCMSTLPLLVLALLLVAPTLKLFLPTTAVLLSHAFFLVKTLLKLCLSSLILILSHAIQVCLLLLPLVLAAALAKGLYMVTAWLLHHHRARTSPIAPERFWILNCRDEMRASGKPSYDQASVDGCLLHSLYGRVLIG